MIIKIIALLFFISSAYGREYYKCYYNTTNEYLGFKMYFNENNDFIKKEDYEERNEVYCIPSDDE